MKRALVTGGAGFIGSAIVRRLLSDNVEVIVLDDLSTGYIENIRDLPIDFIEGDIRKPEDVIHAVANVDVIFHLAGSVGNKKGIDYPLVDSSLNLLGTINILEAAKAAKVDKVVYSSSAGIFGELKELPISETHPLDPETPYCVSKLAGEHMCLAYTKLYGIKSVCLRYFNVYGPRQRFDAYGNVIPKFVFSILNDPCKGIEIYGDGNQTRDFVHVDDVAEANVLAAKTVTAQGCFNVGSGRRISINKLVEKLRGNDLEIKLTYGPERYGDVRDSLADISLAQKKFGFKPKKEIGPGLKEYVEWAKSEVKN